MAMIFCKECGKEISDKADKCPNCGCPVQKSNVEIQINTKNSKDGKTSGLSITALILSVIGCTFIIGAILAIIDLCKKDGRKKTCSIIALIICVIWLIIGVANSGNTNTKTNTNSNNSAQKTNSESVQDNNNSETNEDAKVEEPGPAVKDKYYVGDTWENKYVLVSYDDCGDYVSGNQFIQPSDGNKYIYATFTFENVGSSDTTVGYWDFDCYADGYACEGTYGADDAGFTQTLSSGRKITGSVYFEIPENTTEIEFEYSPSFWTSEKVVFVFQ